MQQSQVGWVATGNFWKWNKLKKAYFLEFQTYAKMANIAKLKTLANEDLVILTVCWFIKTTNVKPTSL